MRTKRLQNRVAESRASLPLMGLYALVVCMAGGLFGEHQWTQLAILIVSSFLMMELNNANALIRIYSRMVSCTYLALAVMAHFLFTDIKSGLVQACFIAFYLFLFSAYQDKRAVGKVFYAFAMLGLASMMYIQILFFVPFIWIMLFANIMVGNTKTIAASLMGIATPYWIALSYYLFIGDTTQLYEHFAQLTDFGSLLLWREVPLVQIVTMLFVFVMSIVGIVHFRLNNYKDKIRTRMLFEVFTTMAILTMVLIVLQPQYRDYLFALLIVSTSPMVGHYIALTNTMTTNITFCVISAITLFLTICNIWMPF